MDTIAPKGDHYFVALHDKSSQLPRIVAILPLTLIHKPGHRVLTWLGNKHFNYLGGLYDTTWLENLDEDSFKSLWSRIKSRLPRYDILSLNDQPSQYPTQQGQRISPFLWLGSAPAPNTAHQLIYPHHNWPELLASMRNKKTRKRMRNEESRLSREGDLQWKVVETEAEIDQHLPTLLEQRRARLQELGITPEKDQAHYLALYREMLVDSLRNGDQNMRMMIITLDTELLAGIVFFTWKNSYFPLINSMTQSHFRRWSPGEYLLRLMMIQGCKEQIHAVDYGPGEDKYKTAWCNQDTALFDTQVPETLLGHIIVGLYRLQSRTKRTIKNTPHLWDIYRKVRKWRHPGKTAPKLADHQVGSQ